MIICGWTMDRQKRDCYIELLRKLVIEWRLAVRMPLSTFSPSQRTVTLLPWL